jgi:hypothetical protein
MKYVNNLFLYSMNNKKSRIKDMKTINIFRFNLYNGYLIFNICRFIASYVTVKKT